MKEFLRIYNRNLKDYPSNLADAGKASVEFLGYLALLTLPVTFPLIYPIILLWRKYKV